jgi:energy-coupling factor transporter transmembrane protein EcfT
LISEIATLEKKYQERYCSPQLSGVWFRDFNPLSKLTILLLLAFTALVLQNWKYGIGLIVFYYCFATFCRQLKYFNKYFSKLLIIIGVFIIVVRQITVDGTTMIFSIFGWNWTWEGLENGLNMAFIILGFSGAVIIFYAVTPMRDLMYALEQKGVSHTTSYVMLASFTTITDLNQSAKTILDSQKARGIETEGNILVRAKALMPVIGPLLLGAITSAEEKSIAMDARAFSVKRKHTFLRQLRPTPGWEKAVAVLVILYFLGICAIRIYSEFFAGRGA